MDLEREENDSDQRGTSSLDEDSSSSSSEDVCIDYRHWFEFGNQCGVLKAHCLSMLREFHREPKNAGTNSRSLMERVEDAWYYVKQGWHPASYNEEVDRFCSIASICLQNRMSYLLLVACGEKLPPEDEPDTRRPWPPAHLPEVWFDLESSFEL
jgi:hypothetical protein